MMKEIEAFEAFLMPKMEDFNGEMVEKKSRRKREFCVSEDARLGVKEV